MVSFEFEVVIVLRGLFNYLGGLGSYPVVGWLTYWARIESRIGSCSSWTVRYEALGCSFAPRLTLIALVWASAP